MKHHVDIIYSLTRLEYSACDILLDLLLILFVSFILPPCILWDYIDHIT